MTGNRAKALLGAVLLVTGGAFLLAQKRADRAAELSAQGALRTLETFAGAYEPTEQTAAEPTMRIGEFDYIGTISFPTLWLELPVMTRPDGGRIELAPCRQFGTVAGEDLVIAAHNHPAHFGRLTELHAGDPVVFTDAAGASTAYEVARLCIVAADDVESVRASGYPLTLYTCTPGGESRRTVLCDFAPPGLP